MKLISKLSLLAVILASTFLVGAKAAYGCSCMPPDAEALFSASDGVFVGTLIEAPSEPTGLVASSADPVPYVFEVEAAFKGEITSPVTVISAISGASCGLEMPEGASASLFVTERGGEWHGSLCETMGPEALLDGPFDPIPVVAGDAGPLTETSLARWVLLGIGGIGAAALAVARSRKRPETR